jgi:hypothetical protein
LSISALSSAASGTTCGAVKNSNSTLSLKTKTESL